MERDERHGVRIALVRVLVGGERGLLEQPVEGVLGLEVVVAGRDRTQLEEVRPALLPVLRPVGEHRAVAGRLEDLVEQLGEWRGQTRGPHPPDESGEVGQRAPRPGGDRRHLAAGRALVAPHVVPGSPVVGSGAAAATRSASTVLSPIDRAGTLMIQLEAHAVRVAAQDARVGDASLTSRRL